MATRKGPHVVRRGTKKDKNLRTFTRSNGNYLMGSTQGYDDPRSRQISDEQSLRALFHDKNLHATAVLLAVEKVQDILADHGLALSDNLRYLLVDTAVHPDPVPDRTTTAKSGEPPLQTSKNIKLNAAKENK